MICRSYAALRPGRVTPFTRPTPAEELLEEEIDMTTNHRVRRWTTTGAGLALALSLAACGGNVGGGSSAADEEFPGDEPITIYVGQDAGGSTDLIARALAEGVSDDLGVAVTVENKPGANGALAAQELAGEEPDGHTLMVYNGSLAYVTP